MNHVHSKAVAKEEATLFVEHGQPFKQRAAITRDMKVTAALLWQGQACLSGRFSLERHNFICTDGIHSGLITVSEPQSVSAIESNESDRASTNYYRANVT